MTRFALETVIFDLLKSVSDAYSAHPKAALCFWVSAGVLRYASKFHLYDSATTNLLILNTGVIVIYILSCEGKAMEVNVALNFQFDDANLKTQVADAFQAASLANSRDGIVAAFSSLTDADTKSALEKLVNENRGDELLQHAGIRVLKTKISFECVAPHEDEEFVENFMNFITALGGKPLTSKTTGEQGEEYTYKFANGKMSVSYNEDEEW